MAKYIELVGWLHHPKLVEKPPTTEHFRVPSAASTSHTADSSFEES